MKKSDTHHCIARGCGAPFSHADAMKEDLSNLHLKAFYFRYCRKHRYSPVPLRRFYNQTEPEPPGVSPGSPAIQ
jgi:hypothetical protein